MENVWDKYSELGDKVRLEDCPVGPFAHESYLYFKTDKTGYRTIGVRNTWLDRTIYYDVDTVVQPLILKEEG